MSDFIDNQAEESENEGSVASDASGPRTKKRKVEKKKKRKIESSDEEEEEEDDDEAKVREEMKGFVVDEDEDEGDGEESDNEDNKSDKSGSENEELLDDDLELVNENIGVKVGGRVEISDDEDDRDRIGRDLFTGAGDEDDEDDFVDRAPRRDRSRSESSGGSEEDDRFIVEDDEGAPRRRRYGGPAVKNRAELREAQDIFGFEDDDLLDIDNMFDNLDEEEEGLEEGRAPKTGKTLLSLLEPEELEQHQSEDHKIIYADIPERFQVRPIPVCKAEEDEIKQEAMWILKRAFDPDGTVSRQEGLGLCFLNANENVEKVKNEAPEKIGDVLNFIRNSNLEVPFIAFYRKEQIDNVLQMTDLWTIYEADEKWLHLRDRKLRLQSILRRMAAFVSEVPESEGLIRPVKDEDYTQIAFSETHEEVNDCFEHFQLYYANFLTRMVQHEIERNDDPEHQPTAVPKTTAKNDKYWSCALNGPGQIATLFGLSAEQVAENVEFPRHIAQSSGVAPMEAAREFVSQLFESPEIVLKGAKYVYAYQLSREPSVRRKIREMYRAYARLRVYPTRKGLLDIDDASPIFPRRYLSGKPVRELRKAEFLEYHAAREAGLLNVEVYVETEGGADGPSLAEDFMRNDDIFGATAETSQAAMEWKRLREEALRACVLDVLCPFFARETYEALLDEARKCVLRECRAELVKRLQVGPYHPTIEYYNEDDELEFKHEPSPQLRLVAIAPPADQYGESIAVALRCNGEVTDTCPVVFRSRFDQRLQGDSGNVSLRAFVQLCRKHRPHVIAVAGTDMRALGLKRDIEKTLDDAAREHRLDVKIPVEIVTAETARIFANSKTGQAEFPDMTPQTRLTVSAGRCLMDPLFEYSRLYNKDEDYCSIRLHALQAHLPKRDLAWAFQREFIGRVNEVGVDLNHCIEYPHTNGVVQFVSGFGPRKAEHVMQLLSQQGLILDARSKLVTLCSLGPTIFINCAGFIRIDIERVRDVAEDYVEHLDGSRVHPETYEWARKMAMDALEYDESNDPASAIDDVIKDPDRLKELDLDAFADELARQGFGNKQVTLYDIRAELNHRYKDLRQEYCKLEGMDLFKLLVPNPAHYAEEKLITGRVQRVQLRRADADREPPDPSDARSQVGIRVALDDGVAGFIPRKLCSDDPDAIPDLNDVFKPGMPVVCKVVEFKTNGFSCTLSCRGSDLKHAVEPPLDPFFDQDRCRQDNERLESRKSMKQMKTHFVKRVISHQAFHNVTASDAERMLKTMNQGEAIIRPSSKSMNHLTVTWKVADNIYQHVNIAEGRKKHYFNLGKELKINNESYEDLDEILARFVTPMAEYARDVLSHKYALEGWIFEDTRAEVEKQLRTQKEQNPARFPYLFTVSRDYPGKFVISYHLRRPFHEYFTVTPEGVRFRGLMFSGLENMINWFKVHYREPPRR